MMTTFSLLLHNTNIEIRFSQAFFDKKEYEKKFYQEILLPDGKPWLSIAENNASYLFHFHGLAEYKFDPENKEVQFQPISAINTNTVEHLLFNQVIPYIYSYFGLTTLHASAVTRPLALEGSNKKDFRAVAFLGKTGQGKSTILASFCVHGFQMLTDDCLVVEKENKTLFAYPGQPSLRLWDDSAEFLYGKDSSDYPPVAEYSSKKRISESHGKFTFFNHPAAIHRMYFLDNSPEKDQNQNLEISRLSPMEAFVEILQHSFNIDMRDPERVRRSFDVTSGIASLPIFYRLSYPRTYVHLARVRQAIFDHLDEDIHPEA